MAWGPGHAGREPAWSLSFPADGLVFCPQESASLPGPCLPCWDAVELPGRGWPCPSGRVSAHAAIQTLPSWTCFPWASLACFSRSFSLSLPICLLFVFLFVPFSHVCCTISFSFHVPYLIPFSFSLYVYTHTRPSSLGISGLHIHALHISK